MRRSSKPYILLLGHGEGLSGACLPIGKDSALETCQETLRWTFSESFVTIAPVRDARLN